MLTEQVDVVDLVEAVRLALVGGQEAGQPRDVVVGLVGGQHRAALRCRAQILGEFPLHQVQRHGPPSLREGLAIVPIGKRGSSGFSGRRPGGSRCAAPGQAFQEVVGELGGVGSDTVDEVGLAATGERQARARTCQGTVITPPSWPDPTLAIEQRRVEPRIPGPVPGGPDHGVERRSRLSIRSAPVADHGSAPDGSGCAAPRVPWWATIARRSGPATGSEFEVGSGDQPFASDRRTAPCLPATPTNRPTSWTPAAANAFRSRDRRSGDPTSCSEGSRRARAMSSTSS